MSSSSSSPAIEKADTSGGGGSSAVPSANNTGTTVSTNILPPQAIVANQTSQPNHQTISTPILATAAKSSAVVPSSSSSTTTKKSRKNDNNNNHQTPAQATTTNTNENNFLPIAPQAFFSSPSPHPQHHHHHQGLTLASVQQQLQPGSVAVFTSPMAMATLSGAGPPQGTVQQQGTPPGGQMQHQQQQLVVAPGQAMAPQFSGTFQANGQTHQLIQTPPGMGMMGGLPQVQVIGTNGQYSFAAPQFYTAAGMSQPMLFNMAIPTQNAGQSLAIQLPNVSNAGGGTMIATSPMGQAAGNQSTPVKNQTNQTTIVKGVTISPQQTKTNANNMGNKSGPQAGPQPQTQQAIIQQTTFQQNATNQTFVIGIQGSGPQANGTAIMPSTPTNARKSTGQGRSIGGNKGSNLIQKIQPATSPLLAPAQFKTNTTFAGNPNANSPAIMVHGQGLQPGAGGIQLTNQSIYSPLTSFQTIPWASPTINQQPTQLVAPNGQIALIRTPGPTDQPQHIQLIQTSNNQYQAVQMPMNPGAQQPNQIAGQMQMAPNGQPILASTPINQSLPISIQTNQGVSMSSPNLVSQQTTVTANNMLTVVSSSANTAALTSSTVASSTPRQRPLRPASGQQQQSTTSTQTNAAKSKAGEPNRIMQTGSVPKLAPKSGGGATPISLGTNLPKTNTPAVAKALLPALPKLSENGTITSTSISTSSGNVANKSSGTKVSTATQSVTSISAIVGTTSVTTTTPSLSGLNSSNLVTGNTGSTPKFDNSLPKLNRKAEKKDAASSTDNKTSPMISNSMNAKMKTGANTIRNPNVKMNCPAMPALNGNFLLANNQTNKSSTNVSGQTPPSTNIHTKTSVTNGVLTKSNCSNTPSQVKNKPNDSQVLTHVIDGFVIHESPNPFPINGFLNEFEFNQNGEDGKELETKEQQNVDTLKHKENDNPPQPQAQPRNDLCANCGKNERILSAKKKKWKKYCQICVDQLIKNQQQQQTFANVGSTTTGTNPPPMGTNAVVVNGHGNMPQNIQQANGRVGILKRPTCNADGQNDPKKQRLSSGTAKVNGSNGSTLTSNVNGGTGEAKADNASTSSESDKMWLPAGGTKEPSKWTVQEVYEFMSHLEGCAELADGFKTQEIDGQALMLIKEDHIIDILNTKLGPALKICRKIKELKDEFNY